MLVNGDSANTIGNDMSTSGILDILDMSANVGLNNRIFKDAVTCLVECAILEYKVLRIAEKLFTSQVAIDQSFVLCVPCKLFAIKVRIVNRHVFALPE